ncbi:MAG TPA: hypothetical protein VGL66_06465 [Caulobacteraceae bacterium]
MTTDLDHRRNRAARARAELTQTEAAFAKLREGAIEKWLGAAAADTETREACWRIVKTLDVVRADLFAAVEDGRVVEAIVERGR